MSREDRLSDTGTRIRDIAVLITPHKRAPSHCLRVPATRWKLIAKYYKHGYIEDLSLKDKSTMTEPILESSERLKNKIKSNQEDEIKTIQKMDLTVVPKITRTQLVNRDSIKRKNKLNYNVTINNNADTESSRVFEVCLTPSFISVPVNNTDSLMAANKQTELLRAQTSTYHENYIKHKSKLTGDGNLNVPQVRQDKDSSDSNLDSRTVKVASKRPRPSLLPTPRKTLLATPQKASKAKFLDELKKHYSSLTREEQMRFLEKYQICYYHIKYGFDAKKCDKRRCNFTKNFKC